MLSKCLKRVALLMTELRIEILHICISHDVFEDNSKDICNDVCIGAGENRFMGYLYWSTSNMFFLEKNIMVYLHLTAFWLHK